MHIDEQYDYIAHCSENHPARRKPVPRILTWSDVHNYLVWEILFICGGALVLAEGSKVRPRFQGTAKVPRYGQVFELITEKFQWRGHSTFTHALNLHLNSIFKWQCYSICLL